MTDAEKLLKEAQKIIRASTLARQLNKDWLQRVADYFRRLK